MAKFFTETGIRLTDWEGVHWARWSDAVREAGFSPNRMAEAYDEAELLERFANLSLELRRLRTQADLQLYARNNPGFPSDKPFRKLGSKARIVARLADFCRTRSGYEPILQLCEAYAPRPTFTNTPAVENPRMDGFVYLAKSGRFFKIGKTVSPGRREYELAIQLPERIKAIHVIRTDDPGGIEAYWHQRFAPKRRNGEWFALDPVDVAAFKRRKFM